MRIVKITGPREGFIYEKNGAEFLYSDGVYDLIDEDQRDISFLDEGCAFLKLHEEGANLIGALNITHRIEGGKLVEIPRRDIEVGDVFKNDDGFVFCITDYAEDEVMCCLWDTGNCDVFYEEHIHRALLDRTKRCGYEKYGIMGVHFEIDWRINHYH